MKRRHIASRLTAMLAATVAFLAVCGAIAPAALASQANVSPRVKCGGFNGHVGWTPWYDVSIYNIHVWGILWSRCNNTYASLELSYAHGIPVALGYTVGGPYGFGIASEGINGGQGMSFPPGGISVRVCVYYPGSNYITGGPHVCGRPWPV